MEGENTETKVAAGRLGLRWQARSAGGISQGMTSASAALLAYLPAKALGLQEGLLGCVGGLVGAVLVPWTGQSLAGYALPVIVSNVGLLAAQDLHWPPVGRHHLDNDRPSTSPCVDRAN